VCGDPETGGRTLRKEEGGRRKKEGDTLMWWGGYMDVKGCVNGPGGNVGRGTCDRRKEGWEICNLYMKARSYFIKIGMKNVRWMGGAVVLYSSNNTASYSSTSRVRGTRGTRSFRHPAKTPSPLPLPLRLYSLPFPLRLTIYHLPWYESPALENVTPSPSASTSFSTVFTRNVSSTHGQHSAVRCMG
jgi:hypothetical protein